MPKHDSQREPAPLLKEHRNRQADRASKTKAKTLTGKTIEGKGRDAERPSGKGTKDRVKLAARPAPVTQADLRQQALKQPAGMPKTATRLDHSVAVLPRPPGTAKAAGRGERRGRRGRAWLGGWGPAPKAQGSTAHWGTRSEGPEAATGARAASIPRSRPRNKHSRATAGKELKELVRTEDPPTNLTPSR